MGKILKRLFMAAILPLASFASTASLAADLQAEGRIQLSQGDNVEASKKFAEAAKVNPFDPSAINNQAVAVAAQGDYEKALALLERAVRLGPGRADIVVNLQEMRRWVARNAPQIKVSEKSNPVMNVYPDSDIPPEPPPLWKK
ncbi:tetratricopeptide repeat protein [Undibacterium sp. SXout11W]|uniref:tetratricopeptide repeat protein n=1 Tax=Undibacterium sp. SXout11W TaxID=3413050 RepID=UPI003BF0E445